MRPIERNSLRRMLARMVLPRGAHRRAGRLLRRVSAWPPVGLVRWGELRTLRPLGPREGPSDGERIGVFYAREFLRRQAQSPEVREALAQALLLEGEGSSAVADLSGYDRIERVVVSEGRPTLESSSLECIVCAFALGSDPEPRELLGTLHDALTPGGHLLVVTGGLPGPGAREELRFTTLALRRLLEERFPAARVAVESYGNVLTAAASLHGILAAELDPAALSVRDPDYQVVVAGSATKASG